MRIWGGGVRVMDKEYRERMRQDEGAHEAIPRKVFITRADLEENGYTVGCPGCKAILRGTTRQLHSKECRRRLEEISRTRRRRGEQGRGGTNLSRRRKKKPRTKKPR